MLPVTLVSLVGSNPPIQRQMTVNTARHRIRANRAAAADVRMYETTSRDGVGLHIAYVQYGPGSRFRADDVTYVFEIPAEALTAL